MLLGADGAFVVPLGNFSDGAGLGFGALLRYEYNIMPKLNATGRLGFVYHLGKDQTLLGTTVTTTFYDIPVLVGAKYDIIDALYLAGEVGFFYNHASASVGGVSASTSETDFGLNVGAGYRMGDLEVRAGLQFNDLGHASDTMSIVANVGYSFMRM
jgi:hypothetical protein